MKGIIFTDTNRLAEKFYGEVLSESHQRVLDIINAYIAFRKKQDVTYTLLDVAELDNIQTSIKGKKLWQQYETSLNNYWSDVLGRPEEPCVLYIIGGNDVIPVPKILNFVERSGPMRYLLSDFVYSFCDKALIPFTDDSYSWLLIRDFIKAKPKYMVSRLPLEEGRINESCLTDYFGKIEAANNKTVSVNKMTCMSCAATKKTAERITKNLKMTKQQYNSPSFDMGNQEMLDKMLEKSKDSEFLSFVLHGSSLEGKSSYKGKSKNNRVSPTAFTCDVLKEFSNLKIIAGLCCWGARFVNHKKDDSMLLTALSDTPALSFTGSSNAVFGGFDVRLEQTDSLSYGELLLEKYESMISEGCPTCEALFKAKYFVLCYYIKHFANSSVNNYLSFRVCLSTIYEFGCYGDPFIKLDTFNKTSRIEDVLNDTFDLYNKVIAGKTKGIGSIYAIRRNFELMVNDARRSLYGNPEFLKRINSYAAEFGYSAEDQNCYTYDNGISEILYQDNAAESCMSICVDNRGEILEIIQSY